MTNIPCNTGNDNRMVIAISNGDININDPFRFQFDLPLQQQSEFSQCLGLQP
jgi:hypothetical protein